MYLFLDFYQTIRLETQLQKNNRALKYTMNLSDTQIVIALMVSVVPAFFAARLGFNLLRV